MFNKIDKANPSQIIENTIQTLKSFNKTCNFEDKSQVTKEPTDEIMPLA